MSLQVWLPLNGNLNNQGLSNVTITNNGATVDTNGKTGSCYSFNGTTNYLTLPTSIVSNFTDDISVSCWVNITAWGSQYDSIFKMYANNTSWANCIFGMGRNGTSSKLYFSIGNTSSSTQANCVLPSDQSTGTWYHLCAVVDTTAQLMSLYLDGELKKTYSTTIVPKFSSVTSISIGGTPLSNYGLNGLINDVRIYNHALSAQEVKEISKGLILHYPLDRNGWGQDNIASKYVVPGSNAPTTTTTAGRTVYVGDYSIKIPATENADTYFSIYYSNPIESGKTYTLSGNVSGIVSGTYYRFPLFQQSNTGMGVWQLDHNGICSLTFTMNYTGTIPTSVVSDVTYYRMFMDDSGRNIASGQGDIIISNIKLEEGSKVTNWIPNINDPLYQTMNISSAVEYDVSGYQRNGTRVGNLTWDTDSPKYGISTHFNGIDGKVNSTEELSFLEASPFTISFWAYCDDWTTAATGAAKYLISHYNATNGGFRIYTSANANRYRMYWLDSNNTAQSIYFSASGALTSGWYFFTATYDGTTMKTYINGQAYTSKTGTFKNNSSAPVFAVSSGSSGVAGKMSDVRIYATALSAGDILELYNNKVI